MFKKVGRLVFSEEGQGMTEYGLILGLIAVVVVAALTLMGTQIKSIFNSIVKTLGGTPSS